MPEFIRRGPFGREIKRISLIIHLDETGSREGVGRTRKGGDNRPSRGDGSEEDENRSLLEYPAEREADIDGRNKEASLSGGPSVPKVNCPPAAP